MFIILTCVDTCHISLAYPVYFHYLFLFCRCFNFCPDEEAKGFEKLRFFVSVYLVFSFFNKYVGNNYFRYFACVALVHRNDFMLKNIKQVVKECQPDINRLLGKTKIVIAERRNGNIG